MLNRLALILIFAFLLACAQKPTAYEMAKADYGHVPASYQRLIINKIKESLPDPESATIDVAKPFPAIRYLGLSKGGKYEYGQVVHVWVTTKDTTGHEVQKFSKIFWWNNTGWNTMLPSLEGITPKYLEQAEEYTGVVFTRY